MDMWTTSPNGISTPFSDCVRRGIRCVQCGVMKPAPTIFQMMLSGQNALPEETLFIDDSETNVKVAQSLGIHTLCPHDNEDWTLFPEIQKLLQE